MTLPLCTPVWALLQGLVLILLVRQDLIRTHYYRARCPGLVPASFLRWLQVVCSQVHADRWTVPGILWRFPCVALSSMMLFPVNPVCVTFPEWLALLSLFSPEATACPVRNSLSPVPPPKHHRPVLLHGQCFDKSTFSHILFAFWLIQRGE